MPESTVPSNDDLMEVIDAVCQAAIALILKLCEQPEQDRTPATAMQILKDIADMAEQDGGTPVLQKATYYRLSQLFATCLSLRDVKSLKIN